MTHSGQGDEQRLPAARPAHEGVVLPADGSEPLIPGAQAAPAGGQPWGAPWGPQQPPPQPPQSPEAAPPGYGYPAPSGGYGYPAPAPAGGYGYPAPAGGYGYPAQQAAHAGQAATSSPPQPGAPAQFPVPHTSADPQGHYAPAPQGGTQQFAAPGAPAGAGPQGGYAQAAPQGGAPQGPFAAPGASAGAPPPQAVQGAGAHGEFAAPAAPGSALPPQAAQGGYTQAASQGQLDAPGALPPQAAQGAGPQGWYPQAGDGQAPGPHAADTRGGAPAPGADSDATQYIAPVGPGALPPEMPAESTTFLGTGRLDAGGPQGGDAEATQYIAPVPPAPSGVPFGIRPGAPGDRQPPAEFDSLFRSEGPGGAEPADATQQMPRFEGPPPAHQQAARSSYQPPGRQEPRYDPEPVPGRRSTAPVVAALVVGCAVLGLGLGAVMFSGGDDDKDPAPDKNVAADSPTPGEASPSTKAADPAEPQARELDKLLADSNNSRAAVIRSVENIRVCKNLDQAAADLKGAAQQRRDLVTRLGTLSVDKLPDDAALTASLTKAWQASASADDHYAAWALQTKGKKGCKDGKARVTKQTAQGNQASGEATTAKNEASKLWNAIARKHGLTERSSSQL
ncbi:hypothetical protein [Streptomyces xantholiticus]|uniref:Uncharacterized protein n=1 Tax=Streptomyces xantholiticus TaxID=68285 RepID=A0ABV1UXP8_9ACTN